MRPGSPAAVFTLRYGPDPSQFARLHLPALDVPGSPGHVQSGRRADPDSDEPRVIGHRYPRRGDLTAVPVAVVVHGGFWRQRYDVSLADPLAADLAAHGVAALAVEYRRVGVDSSGAGGQRGTGGWPRTGADVAAAVDALAVTGQYMARGRLDLTRVAAIGHSAGGQLAAWLPHRPLPAAGPPPVRVLGAVSQAGVLDVVAAADDALGAGAVTDFLGADPRQDPQRYADASPLAHVGRGVRVVCVHGDADDVVPLAQSRVYVEAATAAGDPAALVTLPGVGHYELIDPADPAWTACRTHLLTLLGVMEPVTGAR